MADAQAQVRKTLAPLIRELGVGNVAHASGITRATISKFINGGRIRPSSLDRIAAACGYRVEQSFRLMAR